MKEITEIETIENMLKIGNYLKMFRVNFNGLRLYIKETPFTYYSGLTGALSASMFSGNQDKRRLDKWRTSMIDSFGEKNTNDFVEFTADFGHLLHAAAVTIKDNGCINWNEEKDKAFEYFVNMYKKKFLEPDIKVIKKQTYEYQKHVASLMQFHYDMVQEVYAIETPAIWEGLKIATPIDEFCKCRQTPKGDFANTTINFKTSSAINKHQMNQVACEMTMWNETYNEKADFTAIMRTKDWIEGKIATYEYKYMDKEMATKLALKCSNRLALCLDDEESTYYPSPINKSFNGITKIGQQPIIVSKNLQEEWAEMFEFEQK
jgi:hypothetical protein